MPRVAGYTKIGDWNGLVDSLEPGDTLRVKTLSVLSNNGWSILNKMDSVFKRGASIYVEDDNLHLADNLGSQIVAFSLTIQEELRNQQPSHSVDTRTPASPESHHDQARG